MVTIHLILVICTMLIVLYSDEQGLMWVTGKKQVLSRASLETLHAATGLGLSVVVLTGGLMFLDRATYLLSTPVFIVKMMLVLALIINSFFIGSYIQIATEQSFASLSSQQRTRLYIAAVISSVGWIGAIICGLLL